MPPKRIAYHCTDTTTSQLAKRVVENLSNIPPHPALVGAFSPPQAMMVAMDQFNLLVVVVQNMVVAIQAIQDNPALHP